MSRVCVKGLRKSSTEKELREAFSTRGEVTDVRVMRTKAGKSRQFAFVGFRTEAEALSAQAYFNGTFVDSAKVVVEVAKRVGDSSLAKPENTRSKHSSAPVEQEPVGKTSRSDNIKVNRKDKNGETGQNKQSDSKDSKKKTPLPQTVISKEMADFLETAKPRSQAQTWSNDAAVFSPVKTLTGTKRSSSEHSLDSEDDTGDESSSVDSDDDVNDFTKGIPSKGEKGSIKEQSKVKKNDISLASAVGESIKRSSNADLDYLRSKVTNFSDDEDEENEDEEDKDEENEGEENEGEEGKNKSKTSDLLENPEDTGRLFVRNLPYSCTEEELRTLFDPYGLIESVHLPIDKEKGGGKGYGFVQYLLPEHAHAALTGTDGSAFQGRVLHVIYAERSRDDGVNMGLTDRYGKPLSEYQAKKEAERRAAAGKTMGWNASFVRSETALESIAQRHGVDVSDILDTAEAGGEMAVRMAVGEAKIIQENRDYFSAHGVDINALESQESNARAVQRSQTTILVKNLPKDTDNSDLEPLFSHYGTVADFLLPPSKTVALVDFVEPTEARSAFKGLAYRRYRHTPLYLEWAPMGIINNAAKHRSAKQAPAIEKEQANIRKAVQADGKGISSTVAASDLSRSQNEDIAAYQTLFLKNLSFGVTQEMLEAHLESLDCGRSRGLRAVSIPVKERGSKVLSMGFGFAEYANALAANTAMARLQGSLLDSHKMEVKPSDKSLSGNGSGSSSKVKGVDKNNCKLVVRNVAFQATQAELRALFATFGNVKRVRIPKKMQGDHRGFAFIDFSTPQEAAAAMSSLTGTHFYGRRLVLEWAKEDNETLETLRVKASADTAAISHAKKKARIDDTEDGMGDD